MTRVFRLLRQHPLWLVPTAVWMLAIWQLSDQPASAYRRVGRLEARRLPVPMNWLAVVSHFGAFGALAVGLFLGLPVRRRIARAVSAWVGALTYGIVDERHQSRVPGRDASIFDVVTDGAGALAGIVVTSVIQRRLMR